MKFTSIAVASVAYMAAAASAFSWGCQDEHYYGAKDVAVDIHKAISSWIRPNFLRGTTSTSGTWLVVSCTSHANLPLIVVQDCSNALDWLWATVNGADSDYLDKKGLVPRSCWVDNDKVTVMW